MLRATRIDPVSQAVAPRSSRTLGATALSAPSPGTDGGVSSPGSHGLLYARGQQLRGEVWRIVQENSPGTAVQLCSGTEQQTDSPDAASSHASARRLLATDGETPPSPTVTSGALLPSADTRAQCDLQQPAASRRQFASVALSQVCWDSVRRRWWPAAVDTV